LTCMSQTSLLSCMRTINFSWIVGPPSRST
jgi:hypothetical protein